MKPNWKITTTTRHAAQANTICMRLRINETIRAHKHQMEMEMEMESGKEKLETIQ